MKHWQKISSVAERHIIKWNSSSAKGAGFLAGGGRGGGVRAVFLKALQQFHIKNQSSVQFHIKNQSSVQFQVKQ
jgi:hypothetical protein